MCYECVGTEDIKSVPEVSRKELQHQKQENNNNNNIQFML
jgi:hypothetical protein